MKITSNIENSNYTQWITGFVESVINQSDLKCDEVIIDEVDDKRIWLVIDGAELFFVKYFSLKKASEFPFFSKGFSLSSAGIMHPCA